MNINIPSSFSKEEFEKQKRKFQTKKFETLQAEFINKYEYSKDTGKYTLKQLADGELARLDYIFKRVENNKPFDSLKDIAHYFRALLEDKKYIVLFAYNGTGKTRLSAEFKSLGQHLNEETAEKSADTLYYNAFTEDLFYWDNDLENDEKRLLKLNSNSRFFSGLRNLEMENKIRPLLHGYADFDFTIDYEHFAINFSRNIIISDTTQNVDSIKISRGEENIFIWCFFLAIVQLVADKEESYNWVKYIYVDDPISSLDDNNAVAVACHLAEMIRSSDMKIVVSTHHALFFNVLCNEIKNAEQIFLQKSNEINNAEQMFLQKNSVNTGYILKDTGKTPFFHHIALLTELKKASDTGKLYAYHFNILRSILEKTASFHGYRHFSSCLRTDENEDKDKPIYKRMLDIFSHGNYSLFEPKEMVEDNKTVFRRILNNFLEDYRFNVTLLEETNREAL